MLLVCFIGAILNIFNNIVFTSAIKLPLFLDTILTIAVTFTYGPVWGVLCGTLTNLISNIVWFWGWGGFLFTICNIATAIITWWFCLFFPRELNFYSTALKIPPQLQPHRNTRVSIIMDRMIILILLSFALCIAMSILGGIIAALILNMPSTYQDESLVSSMFSESMFRNTFPQVLKEIFARIPVNIIDRLISVFAGYGIALGYRKLFKNQYNKI